MFGNFSLFKTPFPGRNSVLPSFVPFFVFYIFFLPPFEDLGCFSGCLMSSAGIQKLFCGIYSAFKCSFDEFVGEKVFSASYSSTILAPPLSHGVFMPLLRSDTGDNTHVSLARMSHWEIEKQLFDEYYY